MNKGKFVVVDGMDGSGKGTQLKYLKAFLEEKKVPHIFTREPGGCPQAEVIRERLLSDKSLTPQQEFDLFWEARVLHLKETVLPAIQKGELVVSDRFDSSTWAYQIRGRQHSELAEQFHELREKFVEPKCSPDLYVVFDLEPAISRARVMKDATREGLTTFDAQPLEFYSRVRDGFREFAGMCPVELVEAHQAPEFVFQDFLSRLVRKGIL